MLIGAPEERKQRPPGGLWRDVAELMLAPVLMGLAVVWTSWSTAAIAILILISVFGRKVAALQRDLVGIYTSLAMLTEIAKTQEERICELERKANEAL
jgi:hypothetical protein